MTLSYVTLIAGSIAFILLGYFINKMTSGNSSDLKKKFTELENENKSLNKKVKKEQTNCLSQKDKAEKWKAEFQVLKAELQRAKRSNEEAVQEYKASMETLQEDLKKQSNDNQGLKRINDKLSQDLSNLKQKYKTDLDGSTKWKSEKEMSTREIDSLKEKLNTAVIQAKDYKNKYDSQEEKFADLKMIQRTMRSLKAKNTKLEADVKYWEKKHYDIHHELAELKKHHEGYAEECEKLEELRKGDEVLKSNLLKQIQEYKSKFLDINDKYRQLTSSSN